MRSPEQGNLYYKAGCKFPLPVWAVFVPSLSYQPFARVRLRSSPVLIACMEHLPLELLASLAHCLPHAESLALATASSALRRKFGSLQCDSPALIAVTLTGLLESASFATWTRMSATATRRLCRVCLIASTR